MRESLATPSELPGVTWENTLSSTCLEDSHVSANAGVAVPQFMTQMKKRGLENKQ